MHSSELPPTDVELEQKCAKMARAFQGVGKPANRNQWAIVVAHLIPLSDAAFEELLRQSRIFKLDWLTRVIEMFLTEAAKGNTYRDAEGAIRLRTVTNEFRHLFQ